VSSSHSRLTFSVVYCDATSATCWPSAVKANFPSDVHATTVSAVAAGGGFEVPHAPSAQQFQPESSPSIAATSLKPLLVASACRARDVGLAPFERGDLFVVRRDEAHG